ncbi:hypothetical protein C8R43DRAFT_989174 [Mycena crocata]|nr:hypothetical protein C8R43DRAFT_989174 [Mycena crocata]
MASKVSPKVTSASPASSPITFRPLNPLYILLFASMSALSAWFLRIEPALQEVPTDFLPLMESGRFPNGATQRTTYTGISSVDEMLRMLVTAFIAGPARWDHGVTLQQLHFLLNFFSVICIWTVEACRARNKGRLISYTALFALFYQTVGGAIIIPLYYLISAIISTGDAYHLSGRAVPMEYARGLLFAVLVGYLAPTVAMFVPWDSFETRQLWTAVWQFAPAFVNLLLLLCSFILPSTTSGTAGEKNGDVPYLKRIYIVAAAVSTLNHIATVYLCLTSSNPQMTLSRVFLPYRSNWKDSTTLGLHYLFQVDWWGCFVPALVWAWVSVYDMLRILGKPTAWDYILTAVNITWLSLVAGPGTALALVWLWREDRLVMIEDGVKGTWKKPKTA